MLHYGANHELQTWKIRRSLTNHELQTWKIRRILTNHEFKIRARDIPAVFRYTKDNTILGGFHV